MANYVAGVDIGGTSVKFGVFENGRDMVYKTDAPSVLGDPNKMVDLVGRMVETCPYPVDRVGVGTPGFVSKPQELVTATNLGWVDAPLKKLLTERLRLPVWVDNDAQTQLAAEWWDGACKGLDSAVYIAFGTGIGGAFLFNGRPWRGHTNTAAELGHFITHADGMRCACGLKGCYELYASASALCRMAGTDNAREVIDRARAGDKRMMSIFKAYLHEVAIGIASVYMLFCPQAIVLGGGISAAGEILTKTLAEALVGVSPDKGETIASLIRLAVHRNDAGILGAAALAATMGGQV